MQVLDELVDEQWTLVIAQSDSITGKSCLLLLAIYSCSFTMYARRRTSSSTRVMRECRYSSSERWNSSRSLRFTGTN